MLLVRDVTIAGVKFDRRSDREGAEVSPEDAEIDPDRAQIGDSEDRFVVLHQFAQRDVLLNHRAGDFGGHIVSLQALVALNLRQHLAAFDAIAEALPDAFYDSRETRHDMRQSLFIGRNLAVDRHHRSDCRGGGFLDFQVSVGELFGAQLDPVPAMVCVLVVAFFFVRRVGRFVLRTARPAGQSEPAQDNDDECAFHGLGSAVSASTAWRALW